MAESEIRRIQGNGSETELWRMRFVRARVLAFQGHVEEAVEYLSALTPPDHSDGDSRAALKMYCGSFSCHLGRNDRANRLLNQAEGLARSAGLLSLTGDVLLCRAFLLFRQKDYADSSNVYRSVLDLAETIPDWYSRGHALWGIGKKLMIQCQYTEAMSWLKTSLALLEANDALLSVSTVWSELGLCYLGTL